MYKAEYQAYLKSPEWKEMRARILKRDGYACLACGSKDHLQVHHRTYNRVGAEIEIDLRTLCGRCHESIHAIVSHRKTKHPDKSLRKVTRAWINKPSAEHRAKMLKKYVKYMNK